MKMRELYKSTPRRIMSFKQFLEVKYSERDNDGDNTSGNDTSVMSKTIRGNTINEEPLYKKS